MKDIKKLISEMTLEEKLGQLFMEYMEDKYNVLPHIKDALDSGRIGSIIYFSGCNVEDGLQFGELSAKLQMEAGKRGRGIPLVLAIDQEGGQLTSVRKLATISPGNMAIGATDSIKDAENIGRMTGRQMKVMNVSVNLAPVVDSACNLDVPIVSNRVFGSDPRRVGAMGAAYVKGCQAEGVAACLKHFPGQANSEKDTHWHLDVIDKPLAQLEKNELLPFKMGIDAGVDSLLTIHAIFPALDKKLPATLSEKIINGYLRKTLGFKKLIISDDVYMKAIKNHYGLDEAAYLAIKAGVDIVMGAADTKTMHKYCIEQVRKGKLSMDQVNESVARVLEFKQKYCTSIATPAQAKKVLITNAAADEKVSQTVADHAITVIRNNAGVLPLKPGKKDKIVVIQPGNIRLEMSDAVNLYDKNNLVEEIKKRHDNVREVVIGLEPNKEEIISILDTCFISDIIIVGTQHVYRHPAQKNMMDDIIKLAESKNKKLITVALRSTTDLAYYPEAQTHLVSYGNWACLNKALVKVMFGEIEAVGKLPVPIKGLYKTGYSYKGKMKKPAKKK